MNAPASARAVKYMRDLARERDTTAMLAGMPDSWGAWYHTIVNSPLPEYHNWAQADVSKFIDALKKCPVKREPVGEFNFGTNQYMPLPEVQKQDYNPAHAHEYARVGADVFMGLRDNIPLLQDGMYRGPGPNRHIYKLYHTVNGANVQVAKRLIVQGMPRPGINTINKQQISVKFKYEGRAPLKFLKPSMRLTMEEAAEFGKLYGVCCVCGRILTNELSIQLGIGPICGDREFGGEFTFMVNKAKLTLGMPVSGPIGLESTVDDIDTEEALLARLDEINKELQ